MYRRLLVLGGGPIGLELAQAFQRLGSRVTVVELLDRLLPHDEPEAGTLVEQALKAEGVELLLGSRVIAAREEADEIELTLEHVRARGDALLLATGRRAAVVGLRLDELGVELERRCVRVDRLASVTSRSSRRRSAWVASAVASGGSPWAKLRRIQS